MGIRLGVDIWEIIVDIIAESIVRTRVAIFEYENHYMPPYTSPSALRDLKSLSLVSRWCNELARPRLWRSVLVNKPFTLDPLCSVLKDNPSDASAVIALHYALPHKESERRDDFAGPTFQSIIRSCPNLRYLRIEWLRFSLAKWRDLSTQGDFRSRYANIVALHVAHLWPAITFGTLASLLLVMPKLSVLTLGEIRDDSPIFDAPATNLPLPTFKLKSLSISSIVDEEYSLPAYSWILSSSSSSLDTLQWPLSRGVHRTAVLQETLRLVGPSIKRMYIFETLTSILDSIVRMCPNVEELGIGHFMNFKNFQIPGIEYFSPRLRHLRFITNLEDPKSAKFSLFYFVNDYQVIANTIRDRHPNIANVTRITLDFRSREVADQFGERTKVVADACAQQGLEFALMR